MSILRTVAIGDIHGCLSLLERLLERLRFDPATDRLVFVGDLIDRGPEPAATVRYVRELCQRHGAITVIGNHEEKCVRWFDRETRRIQKGIPNGMSPPGPERLRQWEELEKDDIDWLRSLPIYAKVHPEWIAVHAGFEAKPLEDQRFDRMCRVCYLNPTTGESVSHVRDGDAFLKPPGAIDWMDMWRGPENVVYGHNVHSTDQPRVDNPQPGVQTWGIDTGAVYGGNMTALVLETREIIQVRDGVAYAKLYPRKH